MPKNIPTHPGEVLRDELDARGMSVNALAKALSVDTPRLNSIVNCRRAVTPDTALRLARYFGGGAEVWLGLQMDFDLAKAEKERGREIRRTVRRAGAGAAV